MMLPLSCTLKLCERGEESKYILAFTTGDAIVWVWLVPFKSHGDAWFPAELYWEMRPSGSDKGT